MSVKYERGLKENPRNINMKKKCELAECLNKEERDSLQRPNIIAINLCYNHRQVSSRITDLS